MNQEIWARVKGYESSYAVSNWGRVKSLSRFTNNGQSGFIKKEQIRTPCDNGNGYKLCGLSNGSDKVKNHYIHRLVAEAFVENENNYIEVNHIDGNKSNNHYSNLEWCTRVENIRHARRTGLNVTCPEHMRKFKAAGVKALSKPVVSHDGKPFRSIVEAARFYNRHPVTFGRYVKRGTNIWVKYANQ